VLLHYPVYDGKAQSGTVPSSAEEGLEDPRPVFWLYPRPGILHHALDPVASVIGDHARLDANASARWSVLKSILYEVAKDLNHA
jgi:hypothetical protein